MANRRYSVVTDRTGLETLMLALSFRVEWLRGIVAEKVDEPLDLTLYWRARLEQAEALWERLGKEECVTLVEEN